MSSCPQQSIPNLYVKGNTATWLLNHLTATTQNQQLEHVAKEVGACCYRFTVRSSNWTGEVTFEWAPFDDEECVPADQWQCLDGLTITENVTTKPIGFATGIVRVVSTNATGTTDVLMVPAACEGSDCGGSTGTGGVASQVEVTNLGDIPLAISGDLTPSGFCTDDADELPIYMCKVVDGETGTATFQAHVWPVGSATLAPYSGLRKRCPETRTELVKQCMVDDVNSDGSLVNSFVRMYEKTFGTGAISSVLIGDFTDITCSATYTVLGTEYLASDFGSDARELERTRKLVGPVTFQYPALSTSLSTFVCAIGDSNSPPTWTDSSGEVTPLEKVGMAKESAADSKNSIGLYHTLPSLALSAGDVVMVSWNELTFS